mgnify:CR=1 FL=1
MVDENNNIMKIEEHDGQYVVTGDNNVQKGSMEKEPKTLQMTLAHSPMYSANAA